MYIFYYFVQTQVYTLNGEPWYYGTISRYDAIQHLKADGDYLVRYSTNTGGYVMTLQFEGKHHHVKIQELRDQVCVYVCVNVYVQYKVKIVIL